MSNSRKVHGEPWGGQRTLCEQKEVEPVYERYVDSGLDTYNPIFIQTYQLATSGAAQSQVFRFAPQARATVYINVQGPGVLWLYLCQEGVNPGTSQPHLEIIDGDGIVTIDVAPGAYNWVVCGDGSAVCQVSCVVIEREARRIRCAS